MNLLVNGSEHVWLFTNEEVQMLHITIFIRMFETKSWKL